MWTTLFWDKPLRQQISQLILTAVFVDLRKPERMDHFMMQPLGVLNDFIKSKCHKRSKE